MKYFEAFGEGGFHAAFMTTYAFGSLAFEDIPFPKLRGAGCRNITVLADRAMVNQAFSEFGPPRFAGTSYHLIKVDAPGAFHPKITMLIGETKGRLIVGSANLTALGLGGNKEQLASITYSAGAPENAKFFIGALAYLRRYVPQDDQWFPVSLQRALRSAPWLRDDNFDLTFDASGETDLNLLFDRPDITFLDQIVASIGDDTIERLIVVSPYWDVRLEGLARLRDALGNPVANILIESEANGFPSSALSGFTDTNLFDVTSHAEGRFLHAKLIIAHGERWDHVISGSMNCTFPALMGPAIHGNAEAGIYKRVARGTALEALGLDGYEDARIEGEQLAELQHNFEEAKSAEPTVDGGTLILQAGKISWAAPASSPAASATIQLYDRDGLALSEIEADGRTAIYIVSSDAQRPKYGIVTFAGGLISAPVQIVDLDYLAVTTLPAQRGRKRRLMDTLVESIHEDLVLIETLNQLEALEEEDRASRPDQTPRAKPEAADTAPPTYEVLSYDDFIRARTHANAQGKSFGLYLNSRNDSAASLMSACLNQMIGLVGPDLRGMEDEDIDALGAIDFRTTEPQSADDGGSGDTRTHSVPQSRSLSAQSRATAKKFQEAVTAFESRCKALSKESITTSEMVRLRALIQIVLSHSQPVTGSFSASQILPVYAAEGHDWPRLIGRLLLQHFGTARALQNLTVEPDESEQQRVIEYLAASNWAAKAAYAAVLSNKKAATLRTPLERLIVALTAQTQMILSIVEGDRAYFDEITAKLDERFCSRLALSENDRD
ncbi:hypothetical protein ACFQ1E_15185 [Sphingomonas canadensis]|uniref:Phospholipase D-like domain-containing protein n=1 Tax=Sphingomonas canadensis TaxID=1219257 RepID=A0ABW3HDG0_9SPHN|nr:hypothetical protein [Sphingomonas canadensis]MCW3837455.1 hypothetical protein [Sphingomonas canadensis]